MTTESARCERPSCEELGRLYFTHQRVVSDQPIQWTGTAQTPLPEHPIRLCQEHALDAFGVAFRPESGEH